MLQHSEHCLPDSAGYRECDDTESCKVEPFGIPIGHSHIYMLPPPNGRECIGVCKLCGMTKMHFNSMDGEDENWNAWQGKEKERKGTERK